MTKQNSFGANSSQETSDFQTPSDTPSPLERKPSKIFQNRINHNKATILICTNPNEKHYNWVEWHDFLFFGEEADPIASGNQGKICLAKVIFEDETNEEHEKLCVLKIVTTKKSKLQLKDHETTHEDVQEAPPILKTETHLTLTEEDESSLQHNIIKVLNYMVIENPNDTETYTLIPFSSLFLDRLTNSDPENSRLSPCQLLATDAQSTTPDPSMPDLELVALHVLQDITQALTHLHSKKIVHGDIKPANISYLDGHWCLLDFDTMLPLDEKKSKFQGTLPFMHPGCFADDGKNIIATTHNDIFALGVTLKLILADRKTQSEMQAYSEMPFNKFKEYRKHMYYRALEERGQPNPPQKLENGVTPEEFLSQKGVLTVLLELAERMCSPDPLCQPTLEEITDIVKTLQIISAEKKASPENEAKILAQYYKAHSNKKFDALTSTSSTISSPSLYYYSRSNSNATSLSSSVLCSEGFFGESRRNTLETSSNTNQEDNRPSSLHDKN